MSPHRRSNLGFALFSLAAFIGLNSFLAACTPVPSIVITSPANGAFKPGPGDITVTGTISGLNISNAEVRVNGGPVLTVQPNGNWSTTVERTPFVVFTPILAELTRISDGRLYRHRVVAISGDAVGESEFNLESVGLRISDDGFDQLGSVITTLFDFDFAELIPPGTNFGQQCTTIVFVELCATATVQSATVTGNPPVDIDVDSMQNFVDADIVVNGLQAVVDLSGDIDCTLTITASSAVIMGSYTLEPEAGSPENVDVNQLGNASITLNGFGQSTSCDGFFGPLVELFIPNIQGEVQSGFQDFINTTPPGDDDKPIASAIESALAGVSIAGQVGGQLGVSLDAPMSFINEDAFGISIAASTRLQVTPGAPNCTPLFGVGSAPDLVAAYAVQELLPSYGQFSPGGNLYGLAFSISTTLLNQLLSAQTECGLLQTELTQFELFGQQVDVVAGNLQILIPQFSGFPPDFPLKIVVKPTLAPLFTGEFGPAGEMHELRIAQLRVEIQARDFPLTYIGGFVDTRLGVDLDISGGQISFNLTAPTPQDLQIVIVDNRIGANEATTELILPSVFAPLLPSLASSLEGLPIPTFLGLSLVPVDNPPVYRAFGFTEIFANLE